MVVVLLAVVGFQVFPRHEVTVLSNGQSVRVAATFDPRNEGLAAAAVKLGPGDLVLYGTGGRHASVAVQRAHAVSVEVDGMVMDVRTQATTVGGALAEAGVTLQPADKVLLDGQPVTTHGPLGSFGLASSGSAVPFGAPSGAAGDVAAAGSSRLTVVRARPVTVMVDTLRVDTMSSADTVNDLLAELGITVREVDLVQPGLTTSLTAGLTVRLAPARSVNLKLDGKDQTLYTQAQTVADILRILGVDPGPDEILSLPRSTAVTNGMDLTIGLNRTFTEQVQEQIPPDTVYDTDSTLAAGTIRVLPGTPGLRVTTYTVTTKNGVEASRTVLSSDVVQAPVAAHQVTGTRPAPPKPTLDAPDYTGTYSRKITVKATWYNASQGGKARTDPGYGITATGVRLDYGVCAVDPNVIPLGSWIYVPRYGKCLAADTGGAIKGNIIDLGFPESAGGQPWFTQTLDIYVLD
jgi:uncharacterized protein YabE (DUF348 family)